MNESGGPERISVIWSSEARADLRAIDREAAMQILLCLDRYLSTRNGDVKKLKATLTGFRLRCGDYRLFFDFTHEKSVEITRVHDRKDAYR